MVSYTKTYRVSNHFTTAAKKRTRNNNYWTKQKRKTESQYSKILVRSKRILTGT